MAFVPAPGYQPTYNPTLPYCKPIPGGLSVGMSVYIQGVASDHMKVVVNGNPFYEYGHRLPLQMVTHLQVDGDLQLQSINFIGGQPPPSPQGPQMMPAYPGPGHFHQQLNSLPSMEGPPVFNPPVPYFRRLQGGLTARRTVIIKGFVPPTGKSFTVNFKVGSSGDIALHINPRIGDRTVVRNSLVNGSWGSEEKNISHNPFGPGQFFDLSIRCGLDRFKVFANGQHLFDFTHRISAFQRVDTVEVLGDVTLSYVQI
uniref:Galectin n=1 Tax=Cebus imitator TaxID=2715852 RepID=A0A2K5S7M5_CEBIM